MTGIKCPNCGHDLEFTPEGAFMCAACGKIYRASRSASAPAKAQNTEAKAEEHTATAAENAPAENENAAECAEAQSPETEARENGVSESAEVDETAENADDTVVKSDDSAEGETPTDGEDAVAVESAVEPSVQTAAETVGTAEEYSEVEEYETARPSAQVAPSVVTQNKTEAKPAAGIGAWLARDNYGKAMSLLPACAVFLFAILTFGFLGATVASVYEELALFSFTGYDFIEAGSFLGAPMYSSLAFILSMAVILLVAGIVLALLNLFGIANRKINYGFYVGVMCVYACVFVAGCVVADRGYNLYVEELGEEFVHTGACGVLVLLFSMIYLAGTPFLYVFSVNDTPDAGKENIKAWFAKVKALFVGIDAKVKQRQAQAREKAEAAGQADGADIPVARALPAGAAAPAAVVATAAEAGDDDEILDTCATAPFAAASCAVAQAVTADDDEFVESSGAPAPATYGGGYGGPAYVSRYGLTLDEYIDTRWVIGGRYLYRILSALVLFIPALVATIFMSVGIGTVFSPADAPFYLFTYTPVTVGPGMAVSLALLVIGLVSARKEVLRSVYVFFYIFFYAICMAMFLTGSILEDYNYWCLSNGFWAILAVQALALVLSPIFFGIGMGKRYVRRAPLPAAAKSRMKVVTIVVLVVLLVLSLVLPLACHYTDPVLNYDNAEGEAFSTYTLAGGLEVTSSSNGYYGDFDWYIDTAQEDEGIYTFYSPSAIDYNEYARLEIYNPLSVDVTLDVSIDADWLRKTYWISGMGNTTYVYGSSFTNITLPAKKTLTIEVEGDGYNRELQRATVQIVVDSSLLPSGNDGSYEQTGYYTYVNDTTYPFEFGKFDESVVPDGFGNDFMYIVSTNKTKNSKASFTITIMRSCTMLFGYSVSSETNCDVFSMTYNDSPVFSISGEQSMKLSSLSLQVGDRLVISYSKDGSVDSGNDEGLFVFRIA